MDTRRPQLTDKERKRRSEARKLATKKRHEAALSAAVADPDAYEVPHFCRANGFSRALLYKEWKAGRGPARIRVGRRVFITREAAAQWRRSLESGGEAA